MVAGVLRVELHIPTARSLKDKRSVVKSLKDQIRGRFNAAITEVEPNEKWQRATLGVATLGDKPHEVEQCLQHIVEWIRGHRFAELIKVEQELL